MENTSNNNWLALLRRKIQKKFKRNRQKVNNVEEIAEINLNEISTAEQQPVNNANSVIEEVAATNNDDNHNDSNNSSSNKNNCEEMKKELFKLQWYWPNLR